MPKLIGDLLDIIYNAILVIDSQQKIIFANSRTRRMLRSDDDALKGMDIRDIFMPEDRELFAVNFLDVIRREHEFESEAMLRRLDGSSFLGLLSGTFFHWDNRQEGMAFTIHDITHVKSLERSLKRSERVTFLGRLVDDISHQIRNPVQVIGGFARRLEARSQDTPEIQAIIREAERLEILLDTLNHFISLPRPKPERISLAELVDAAGTRLQEKVTEMGCTWTAHYDDNLDSRILLADLDLLMEAFEAVIVNACESYPESAEWRPVYFHVRWSDDQPWPCQVKVADQGIGISRENLQYAFSHFFSNKTRHVGMGLTLAERIMEEQMGKISIDSVPGQGTVVVFHLGRERRRAIRTTRVVGTT